MHYINLLMTFDIMDSRKFAARKLLACCGLVTGKLQGNVSNGVGHWFQVDT